MKAFLDGTDIFIVKNDFINLQESDAVCFTCDNLQALEILNKMFEEENKLIKSN